MNFLQQIPPDGYVSVSDAVGIPDSGPPVPFSPPTSQAVVGLCASLGPWIHFIFSSV